MKTGDRIAAVLPHYVVYSPDDGWTEHPTLEDAGADFAGLVAHLRDESAEGWHESADLAALYELRPVRRLVLRVTAMAGDDTEEGEQAAAGGWDYTQDSEIEEGLWTHGGYPFPAHMLAAEVLGWTPEKGHLITWLLEIHKADRAWATATINEYKERAEAAEAALAGAAWVPTAASVNALPLPLRKYIHDLETRYDPAGDVQRMAALESRVDATTQALADALAKLAMEQVTRNDGAALITAERARHIRVEGWTPSHDDKHTQGEMARAAACYACPPNRSPRAERVDWTSDFPPEGWPWAHVWWKPSEDRVLELVKAGALIAAEIDRLRRLHGPAAEAPGHKQVYGVVPAATVSVYGGNTSRWPKREAVSPADAAEVWARLEDADGGRYPVALSEPVRVYVCDPAVRVTRWIVSGTMVVQYSAEEVPA